MNNNNEILKSMNLKNIIHSLPNGFHDSRLASYHYDPIAKKASFFLSVWIGDLHSNDERIREQYKSGILNLISVNFWKVEVGDELAVRFSDDDRPTVDIGLVSELPDKSKEELPEIPENLQVYWLYNDLSNSFIYFSANHFSFNICD